MFLKFTKLCNCLHLNAGNASAPMFTPMLQCSRKSMADIIYCKSGFGRAGASVDSGGWGLVVG